jgi:hypothetical protein
MRTELALGEFSQSNLFSTEAPITKRTFKDSALREALAVGVCAPRACLFMEIIHRSRLQGLRSVTSWR